MKIIKTALIFLGALLAAFFAAAYFSASESRFECRGVVTEQGVESPARVFLKLERYRWWVGLWSDSWGSAWIEVPSETVIYVGQITNAGDLLAFWEPHDKFRGNFSTLSKTLGVGIYQGRVFEGTCTSVSQ